MQLLTTDVELSAPIKNATDLAATQKQVIRRNSNEVGRTLLKKNAKPSNLTPVPFRKIVGTPLALSEACSPSEIAQHLKQGRSSFVVRPVFRGLDLSVIVTNKGCSVDFHGSEPFRISKESLSLLRARTRLHKQFQDGDKVKLACRYITLPGGGHWLDIFQATLLREGKILLKDNIATRIGEPINHGILMLNTATSDVTEVFKLETQKVLAEIGNANSFFGAKVEALLWFPQNPYTIDTLQTVRTNVSALKLVTHR